jgi:hypothetical protein
MVTVEEMKEVNDLLTMSVMKLLGLSVETRYTIYREVLEELQVINDFSVDTVTLISNLMERIVTGNHEGAEDLCAKTRPRLVLCRGFQFPLSTSAPLKNDYELQNSLKVQRAKLDPFH